MAKNAAILAFLLALVVVCSTVSAHAQPEQAKKHIAFRDDDVQPFASTRLDALKAVNLVHIVKNVPVTLGIVPHPLDSEEGNQLVKDDQFFEYMKSIASNPLFEFAQHGYSHKSLVPSRNASEFAGEPYDEQYTRILKGQTEIKDAFGLTPATFIPPWNRGDLNTEEAAAALGFTHYNIYVSPHHYQYGNVSGMLVEGAFTIGAANDTEFSASIEAAKNATERFLTAPDSDDTLTIAYHAWEFCGPTGAVDANRIQQLIDFIDYLDARNVSFTRLDRSSVPTRDVIDYLDARNVSFTRLDRSSVAPHGNITSPLQGAGLGALAFEQHSPTLFLLVGSTSIALFGAYSIVLRRSLKGDKHNK